MSIHNFKNGDIVYYMPNNLTVVKGEVTDRSYAQPWLQVSPEGGGFPSTIHHNNLSDTAVGALGKRDAVLANELKQLEMELEACQREIDDINATRKVLGQEIKARNKSEASE